MGGLFFLRRRPRRGLGRNKRCFPMINAYCQPLEFHQGTSVLSMHAWRVAGLRDTARPLSFSISFVQRMRLYCLSTLVTFHLRNALAQIVCAHDRHDFHCSVQVRE